MGCPEASLHSRVFELIVLGCKILFVTGIDKREIISMDKHSKGRSQQAVAV